jgi:hypothetical protein
MPKDEDHFIRYYDLRAATSFANSSSSTGAPATAIRLRVNCAVKSGSLKL